MPLPPCMGHVGNIMEIYTTSNGKCTVYGAGHPCSDHSPTISHLPLYAGCCSGFCAGHYLEPEEVIAQLNSDNPCVNSDPPSIQLKEFFERVGPEPTDDELEEIAANCLLPEDDQL